MRLVDQPGLVAVEGRDLRALAAPGLVEQVVADDAGDRREPVGGAGDHLQVSGPDAVAIGVEVGERAVHHRVGDHPDRPVLTARPVVGRAGAPSRRDGPPREAGAHPPRGVPREAVLVDVDDRRQSPVPRRRDDRPHLLRIDLVVLARRRLVSLPDEEQPEDVEAQVPEMVQVVVAPARGERRDLGIPGEVHAAEDHHPPALIDEMAVLDAKSMLGSRPGGTRQGHWDAGRHGRLPRCHAGARHGPVRAAATPASFEAARSSARSRLITPGQSVVKSIAILVPIGKLSRESARLAARDPPAGTRRHHRPPPAGASKLIRSLDSPGRSVNVRLVPSGAWPASSQNGATWMNCWPGRMNFNS